MFPITTTNFAARLSCVAFSRSISMVLLSAILAGHDRNQPTRKSDLNSSKAVWIARCMFPLAWKGWNTEKRCNGSAPIWLLAFAPVARALVLL